MLSPKAVSGHYARPAVPLARCPPLLARSAGHAGSSVKASRWVQCQSAMTKMHKVLRGASSTERAACMRAGVCGPTW
eukprot:2639827-Prymnesium_polylepis.1